MAFFSFFSFAWANIINEINFISFLKFLIVCKIVCVELAILKEFFNYIIDTSKVYLGKKKYVAKSCIPGTFICKHCTSASFLKIV